MCLTELKEIKGFPRNLVSDVTFAPESYFAHLGGGFF